MAEDTTRDTDVVLGTGAVLRVRAVTPWVFRLRLRPDGEFPEPGLVRYGIVRTDWPEVPVTTSKEGGTIRFDTGQAAVSIDLADGRAA